METKGNFGCRWKMGCWMEGTGGKVIPLDKWPSERVTSLVHLGLGVRKDLSQPSQKKQEHHFEARASQAEQRNLPSGQQNDSGNSQTVFVTSSGPLFPMVRAAAPRSFPWNA